MEETKGGNATIIKTPPVWAVFFWDIVNSPPGAGWLAQQDGEGFLDTQ